MWNLDLWVNSNDNHIAIQAPSPYPQLFSLDEEGMSFQSLDLLLDKHFKAHPSQLCRRSTRLEASAVTSLLKMLCVKTSASVSQDVDLCTITTGFLCLTVILRLDKNQTEVDFSLPFSIGILKSVFLLMSQHRHLTCHTSTHD